MTSKSEWRDRAKRARQAYLSMHEMAWIAADELRDSRKITEAVHAALEQAGAPAAPSMAERVVKLAALGKMVEALAAARTERMNMLRDRIERDRVKAAEQADALRTELGKYAQQAIEAERDRDEWKLAAEHWYAAMEHAAEQDPPAVELVRCPDLDDEGVGEQCGLLAGHGGAHVTPETAAMGAKMHDRLTPDAAAKLRAAGKSVGLDDDGNPYRGNPIDDATGGRTLRVGPQWDSPDAQPLPTSHPAPAAAVLRLTEDEAAKLSAAWDSPLPTIIVTGEHVSPAPMKRP